MFISEDNNLALEDFLYNLDIPEFCFKPDEWNLAFLRGLLHVDFLEKKVLELGVGAGANIVGLTKYHRNFCPISVMVSDIDWRNIDVAVNNIKKHPLHYELFPLNGSYDLFKRTDIEIDQHCSKRIKEIDIVIGCLPQVVTPEEVNIKKGSNIAHYYKKSDYNSNFHPWGLGLIDICLKQASEVVKERVVLNLSGRPGIDKIFELFRQNNFTPNILHEELIPQCKKTSLSSYICVEEESGHCFEFFSDPLGEKKVNAIYAEKLRESDVDIFHYIYVVEGRKD